MGRERREGRGGEEETEEVRGTRISFPAWSPLSAFTASRVSRNFASTPFSSPYDSPKNSSSWTPSSSPQRLFLKRLTPSTCFWMAVRSWRLSWSMGIIRCPPPAPPPPSAISVLSYLLNLNDRSQWDAAQTFIANSQLQSASTSTARKAKSASRAEVEEEEGARLAGTYCLLGRGVVFVI